MGLKRESGLVRAAWHSGTLDEWEEPLSQTFSLVGCGGGGVLTHSPLSPTPGVGSTDKGTQKTALAGTLRGLGEGAGSGFWGPIKPPLQDFRFSGQLLSLRQDLLVWGLAPGV